jgi:hypothetical protein
MGSSVRACDFFNHSVKTKPLQITDLKRLLSSGDRIRTCDLRVMSPTSYLCSTPQYIVKCKLQLILFKELDGPTEKYLFLFAGAKLVINFTFTKQ